MGALVAKKLVNWQSLQERLDLHAVYQLTHFYEQKGREAQPCSYKKQYFEVHRSITKQLNECLDNLHKLREQDVVQLDQQPFSLSIQKSSIHHPLAGNVYKMGALVAKKLVNWQSLQERLDLHAVYQLTHFYEQKGREAQPCSYKKQYFEVHRSITKQLNECLDNLHKLREQDVVQLDQQPFSLSIQKSSIHHPLAGNGVFLMGSVVPGTFITFHPGLVYLAKDVRKMPNYPDISKDNCYLMSRYDGCLLDAKDFNTGIQLPCGRRMTHPFALGHMINHPPPGSKPNVMPFNYDVMESFPSDLIYLIPNRYFCVPGILHKTAAVMRTIVFVATEHIHNEELFVNYRLNPSNELPDWYSPVDLDQDKRRWNMD